MALIYGKDGLSGIPITEMEKESLVWKMIMYIIFPSNFFWEVIKVFEGMSF